MTTDFFAEMHRLAHDQAWLKHQPMGEVLGQIAEYIPQATVVKVHNVADYYYDAWMDGKTVTANDFPTLAPPWEIFWMEYVYPERLRSYMAPHISPHTPPKACGALVISHETPDDPEVRWQLAFMLFMRAPNDKITMYAVAEVISVGPLGAFVEHTLYRNPNTLKDYTEDDFATMRSFIASFMIGPFMFAISLLHCGNVATIEHTPLSLPQTKKRKQKPPRVKFYTLDIQPMKQVLEREGEISKTGLKNALHKCRDHFKDYRDGRGLFGRTPGLWWFHYEKPRGSVQAGIVSKDYNVKAPPPGAI